MKIVRDVHSFFQEEIFNIGNNQKVLPRNSDNGACLYLLEV
jgi:hypothetical protein